MKQLIGGNSYNWIGTNLKIMHKSGKRCAGLVKSNSVIMIPVSARPLANYKIILNATTTSEFSTASVNLFSTLAYDGPHVPVHIPGGEFKNIEIIVSSVNFPQNMPVYLRVFRPSTSAGTIFISSISIEEIGVEPALAVFGNPHQPINRGVASNIKIKQEELRVFEEKNRIIEKQRIASFSNRETELLAKINNPPIEVLREIDEVYKIHKDDYPKVSIVTISYDGKTLLKECYEAMSKNTYYPNWEWVVGDNGSSDDSVAYLNSLNDPRVKVIARGHNNDNFSKANNDLVKYCDGKYLLFLNNDTEPQPFWLIELVSKLEHNDDIGIVGPKLLYPDGRVQQAGIIFVPQGPGNVGFHLLGQYSKDHENFDRYYQAVTGACLMMSKEDFLKIGGFNENYFWCYDDVELCLEMTYTLKKKVLYVSNSVVTHKEHATLDKYAEKGSAVGVQLFKDRWQKTWKVDINAYKDINYNILPTDISFVSCVSDKQQYIEEVFTSLLRNNTKINYELIPVLNDGNRYSAGQALNVGIKKSKGKIIVLLHQDVIMYKNWVNDFYTCIADIEKTDKNWGVLGSAGVNEKVQTIGVVYDISGNPGWGSSIKSNITHPVQTVDEHLMAIRRNSGLLFDDNLPGFHFYGVDLCLNSLDKKLKNYGICTPLTHHGSKSGKGSTVSGKKEYMSIGDYVGRKWGKKFPIIRTSTCTISNGVVHTYLRIWD